MGIVSKIIKSMKSIENSSEQSEKNEVDLLLRLHSIQNINSLTKNSSMEEKNVDSGIKKYNSIN